MASFADVMKYALPAVAGVASSFNPKIAQGLGQAVNMRQAFKREEDRDERQAISDARYEADRTRSQEWHDEASQERRDSRQWQQEKYRQQDERMRTTEARMMEQARNAQAAREKSQQDAQNLNIDAYAMAMQLDRNAVAEQVAAGTLQVPDARLMMPLIENTQKMGAEEVKEHLLAAAESGLNASYVARNGIRYSTRTVQAGMSDSETSRYNADQSEIKRSDARFAALKVKAEALADEIASYGEGTLNEHSKKKKQEELDKLEQQMNVEFWKKDKINSYWKNRMYPEQAAREAAAQPGGVTEEQMASGAASHVITQEEMDNYIAAAKAQPEAPMSEHEQRVSSWIGADPEQTQQSYKRPY